MKWLVYFTGFLLTGVFYGLYAYLFDLIFFQIDYGSVKGYKATPLVYMVLFFVGYIFITLPFFIAYNFLITTIVDSKTRRIITGFTVGLFIGLLINRGGHSYYIGHLRGLKSGITLAATLLSFELARGFFSKKKIEH